MRVYSTSDHFEHENLIQLIFQEFFVAKNATMIVIRQRCANNCPSVEQILLAKNGNRVGNITSYWMTLGDKSYKFITCSR